MKVIAMDLSTTVCGYTIMDTETRELIELNYHKFASEDLLERGVELHKLIEELNNKHDFKTFVIEERLMAFQAKKTNAQAMFNTAQINYLGQYLWHIRGVKVLPLNVLSARKLAYPTFHKVVRTLNIDQKEYAFKLVIEELGESKFPKKILRNGPRKGQEVYLDEAMDMADSFILAKAFCYYKEPVAAPIKKKKRKTKTVE